MTCREAPQQHLSAALRPRLDQQRRQGPEPEGHGDGVRETTGRDRVCGGAVAAWPLAANAAPTASERGAAPGGATRASLPDRMPERPPPARPPMCNTADVPQLVCTSAVVQVAASARPSRESPRASRPCRPIEAAPPTAPATRAAATKRRDGAVRGALRRQQHQGSGAADAEGRAADGDETREPEQGAHREGRLGLRGGAPPTPARPSR